jgi:hypothetical protein
MPDAQLTPVVQALLILAQRGRQVRAQQTAVSVTPLAGETETAAGAAPVKTGDGKGIVPPASGLSTGGR